MTARILIGSLLLLAGTALAQAAAAEPARGQRGGSDAVTGVPHRSAADGEEAEEALRFGSDGRFRIMQLTDLHYTAAEHQSGHVLPLVAKLVEWEHPDLIVLTGDLVYARNAERLLRRIGAALAATGVPYAVTLGNHDAEQGLTRDEVYGVIRTLPGCINARYNADDERQGDFVIPLQGTDGRVAARIYMMDSNDYNADDHSYAGVDAAQVAWYERRSEELERQCGRKVPALLFLHIPLNEFAEAFDADPQAVGFRLERECPGRDNHGLFEALVRRGEVMGLFAGHDHANNYVARKKGIALGYGRYSGGFAEYQELLSGARLFELRQGEEGFVTWERLANGREARRTEFRTEKDTTMSNTKTD